jgi:hypothetical protein
MSKCIICNCPIDYMLRYPNEPLVTLCLHEHEDHEHEEEE